MTAQAISPLRRRIIEDMTIRKFAPKTQAAHIRAVRNFTLCLPKNPSGAEILAYLADARFAAMEC